MIIIEYRVQNGSINLVTEAFREIDILILTAQCILREKCNISYPPVNTFNDDVLISMQDKIANQRDTILDQKVTIAKFQAIIDEYKLSSQLKRLTLSCDSISANSSSSSSSAASKKASLDDSTKSKAEIVTIEPKKKKQKIV